MPRTVEIDDDVYEEVWKKAEDFDDDFNTVMRRILGMYAIEPSPKPGSQSDKKKKKAKRPPPTKAIRTKDYHLPILEYLVTQGGEAKRCDVIDYIKDTFGPVFTKDDKETLEDGKPRWNKNADWARNDLRREASLVSPKPGVWRITRQGRLRLEKEKSMRGPLMEPGDSTRSDTMPSLTDQTVDWLVV